MCTKNIRHYCLFIRLLYVHVHTCTSFNIPQIVWFENVVFILYSYTSDKKIRNISVSAMHKGPCLSVNVNHIHAGTVSTITNLLFVKK